MNLSDRLASRVGVACLVGVRADELEGAIASATEQASRLCEARGGRLRRAGWAATDLLVAMKSDPDVIVLPQMTEIAHADTVIKAVGCGYLVITGVVESGPAEASQCVGQLVAREDMRDHITVVNAADVPPASCMPDPRLIEEGAEAFVDHNLVALAKEIIEERAKGTGGGGGLLNELTAILRPIHPHDAERTAVDLATKAALKRVAGV